MCHFVQSWKIEVTAAFKAGRKFSFGLHTRQDLNGSEMCIVDTHQDIIVQCSPSRRYSVTSKKIVTDDMLTDDYAKASSAVVTTLRTLGWKELSE